MLRSKIDFVREQGFTNGCAFDDLYSPLMFQPRVVGGVVALGILLQSPWLFLALSAVLWWSAIVHTRNPFDAVFNRIVADRRMRLQPLRPAPEPRRFSQGLAGTCALATSVAIFAETTRAAWLLEAVFAGAAMAVTFRRFCMGSFVHRMLRTSQPLHATDVPRSRTELAGRSTAAAANGSADSPSLGSP